MSALGSIRGMPTVLLVEDEDAIALPLTRHLEREGFSVTRAADLATARERLAATPDVVLLDLMLPDGDGRDLCHEIRAVSNVPILMLTARAEVADRVLGLAIGADDYIPKPFAAAEVVARIQAILRRRTAALDDDREDDAPIAIGRVRLDPRTRSVTVDGVAVGLAPREFDLLRHLMANAGRVLRREDIMDAVWDPNWFGSTKTLDVHVAWLRRKIEPDPAAPRYIITARGVGFRFATPGDLEP